MPKLIRACWAPVYVPDGDGHAMNNRWSTVQCGAQHEVHYTWCMSLATVVLQGFFASATLQHASSYGHPQAEAGRRSQTSQSLIEFRAPCHPEPRKRSCSAVVWCSWQKLGLLHAGNLRVPQLHVLGPDPKRVSQRLAHWELAIHSSASVTRRSPLASLERGASSCARAATLFQVPHPVRVHLIENQTTYRRVVVPCGSLPRRSLG